VEAYLAKTMKQKPTVQVPGPTGFVVYAGGQASKAKLKPKQTCFMIACGLNRAIGKKDLPSTQTVGIMSQHSERLLITNHQSHK
jgi:hypothetical protein